MATNHIVKSYDQEITLLTRQVLEMGGLVEHQIASAVDALVKRSVEAAAKVVEADDQIDRMEEEIDQHAIRLLATRQPMAVDLRVITMAMKIANDLERIGDYAANIAKRCKRLAASAADQAALHDPAHGPDHPGDAQGGAGRLCRARRRQGGRGLAPRRRGRRRCTRACSASS